MTKQYYLISLEQTKDYPLLLEYSSDLTELHISIPYVSGHIEAPRYYEQGLWFNNLMNRLRSRKHRHLKRKNEGHYVCLDVQNNQSIITIFNSNYLTVDESMAKSIW